MLNNFNNLQELEIFLWFTVNLLPTYVTIIHLLYLQNSVLILLLFLSLEFLIPRLSF